MKGLTRRGSGLGIGTRRPWGTAPHEDRPGRPPGSLLLALVLACASLMVLDHGADGGPVDALRSGVGTVVGPAQSVTAAAVRPLVTLPDTVRDRRTLQAQLSALEEENASLREQVRTDPYDRERLARLEGLTTTARDLGQTLVPARVVGLGPAQSFSATVTIDAGSDAGVQPDQTVVDADGLVGRVLRTTATTATVLLVVDPDSTVGGRIAETMELGFLSGRGNLGGGARLDLELVDQRLVPDRGDTVLTWGSSGAGPYVAGVPVGAVTRVYESLRDGSKRVVVDPFVDFSELDVVGVVVPSGTRGDRGVVEADGSIR
ncbi:MAG: rod shape-determining protein MreC [Nocardioides sp.]|nr:rod shape-determining protein MreC [Nocardioides sp.]